VGPSVMIDFRQDISPIRKKSTNDAKKMHLKTA
jgi:hypothetical protein